MAKQHIYTRANEGFFTHSEGYDTIALSKGLTEEYIKRNIYPFCFYEKHNFDDIMPDVYYYKYIQNIEGNMGAIFGKNTYIYSSRNYIYCNSLIVCDDKEVEFLYKNFENFIEFNNFSKKVDTPSIIEDVFIDNYFKSYNILMERDFIFKLLSIDENKYKDLLYNIFQCIERKETLYIKLKCNRKFCSRYAKKLLKLLFVNIPSELKKKLSYITYSPVIKIREFFHIVFLDENVDITHEENTDIFFDFSENNKFDRVSIFLDFAWKNVIFANDILLHSNLYYTQYSISDILTQLDKATINTLEKYNHKFISIDENTKLTSKEYIDILNLFFDLRAIGKNDYINTIKTIVEIYQKQLKFVSQNDILKIMDFLLMKKFGDNKDIFLKIIYCRYNLDFNENIDIIIDRIKSIDVFEDFAVISFFYINYMKGLIKTQLSEILNNAIFQKLFYFEEKTNIRKGNIDDLSVYLWKRYRDWI